MKTAISAVTPGSNADRPAARVFYDGACPLCRREIGHYQRLRGADRIDWVDISADQAKLQRYGLSRRVAMARLHVLDAAGTWQTGAWAFAELWSHLPAYRWLAGLLRRSGALPLLDRGYSVFARRRLRRQCNTGVCTDAPLPRDKHGSKKTRLTRHSGAGRLPHTTGERRCA